MPALTRFVLRHKALVVLFWVLVAAAGVMTIGGTTHRMTNNFAMPGQAFKVDNQIASQYGNGGSQPPYLPVITVPAGQKVTDPATAAATGRAFAALARAVPGVRIADYATTHDRAFITRDGRSTFALVYTTPVTGFGGTDLGPAIDRAVTAAAPAGWRVGVTGSALLANGSAAKSKGTGIMAEAMIGSLGALAILALVFASFLALLPLVIGAISVLATFLLVGGLTEVTGVSQIVEFLIALIGLAIYGKSRKPGISPRFWPAAAAGVSYWLLAAFNFIPGREAASSRYVYAGAAFVLLMAGRVGADPKMDFNALISDKSPIGVEVAGAGHNALGAWLWLDAVGRLPAGNAVLAQEISGKVLPVEVIREEGRPVAVSMDQSPPEFGESVTDRAELAAALGLSVGDLVAGEPTQVVSTGAGHLLVPVRDRATVDRAAPDAPRLAAALRQVGGEGCYLYSRDPVDADAVAYTRFFNPTVGIAEDPATGTAAGPLVALLVAAGRVAEDTTVIVEQGYALGRPSRIQVTVSGPRVRVSGSGLVVAEGRLTISRT